MNFQTAQQLIKLNQKSYQAIADKFSNSRDFPWQEVEQVVEEYVKNGDKILDLGCGNGRLLKSLHQFKNFNYLGLDNCNALIKKAQAIFAPQGAPLLTRGVPPRDKKINFICGDILNLNQFGAEEFNVIFMLASFHHIPSNELREKVMTNLFRLLKPGGYLIMTNWNLWQLGIKKSVWRNQKNKITGYQLPVTSYKDIITLWQNKYPLYYHAFTKKELADLFKKNGFHVLKNYYVKKSKKARWWNGYNILTIGQK